MVDDAAAFIISNVQFTIFTTSNLVVDDDGSATVGGNDNHMVFRTVCNNYTNIDSGTVCNNDTNFALSSGDSDDGDVLLGNKVDSSTAISNVEKSEAIGNQANGRLG